MGRLLFFVLAAALSAVVRSDSPLLVIARSGSDEAILVGWLSCGATRGRIAPSVWMGRDGPGTLPGAR